LSVAAKQLKDTEMASEEEREAIIKFMPFSFGCVDEFSALVFQKEKRRVYTTPKSFLELIALFKSMLAKKREEIQDNKEKYEKGVLKLQETGEQVAELEEGLKITTVMVEEKKKNASEQAAIVGGEKTKVDAEAKIANEESAKCKIIADEVAVMLNNVNEDLAAAIPALEKAEAALNGLNVKQF
jgi:dynein heavy chain